MQLGVVTTWFRLGIVRLAVVKIQRHGSGFAEDTPLDHVWSPVNTGANHMVSGKCTCAMCLCVQTQMGTGSI